MAKYVKYEKTGIIMQLKICSYCGRHIQISESCPHCTQHHRVQIPTWSLLLGSGLSACANPTEDARPAYGVDIVDMDGDGFSVEQDCDDEDPDINPDAEEILDDGIDSNCDGEDNS